MRAFFTMLFSYLDDDWVGQFSFLSPGDGRIGLDDNTVLFAVLNDVPLLTPRVKLNLVDSRFR